MTSFRKTECPISSDTYWFPSLNRTYFRHALELSIKTFLLFVTYSQFNKFKRPLTYDKMRNHFPCLNVPSRIFPCLGKRKLWYQRLPGSASLAYLPATRQTLLYNRTHGPDCSMNPGYTMLIFVNLDCERNDRHQYLAQWKCQRWLH